MRREYEFHFQVDLGEAVPGVGSLMNRINRHLSAMGVDEELRAFADVFSMTATANRELSKEEQRMIGETLQSSFNEKMPQYDIHLRSFGRKSGNVEQSAV